MADPPKPTEAQQARIWAACVELELKRRKNEITRNRCIREAYVAAVVELPHESAVALVARYAPELGWLDKYRPTGGTVRAYLTVTGLAPTSARTWKEQAFLLCSGQQQDIRPNAPQEPISEDEQQARVNRIVKDLVQDNGPRSSAEQPPAPERRHPLRAAWLQKQLDEHGWSKYRLAAFGGPDPKSVQKVLDGLAVTEEVFQKVLQGLSAGGVKVDLDKVPKD